MEQKNKFEEGGESDSRPNAEVADVLGVVSAKMTTETPKSTEQKPKTLLDRVDDKVKSSMASAVSLARDGMMDRDGRRDVTLRGKTVDSEHVLMGLVGVSGHDNLASEYLESKGISLAKLVDKIIESRGGPRYTDEKSNVEVPNPTFSGEAKKIYELSLRESLQEHEPESFQDADIRPEHVLAAIFRTGEDSGASRILHDVLEEHGVDRTVPAGDRFKASGPLIDLRKFVSENATISADKE